MTIGLNDELVSKWILGLGIGANAPLTFERIGNGQSNLTFTATDSGGARWVLRRPPLGTLLATAHDIGREYRIFAALADSAVPTPKAVALTDDPAVTDSPLMIVSYVRGTVLDSIDKAEQVSLEQRVQIGASLTDTLAKIHAVDLERTGLSDLASHKPYAPRQLKRWIGQWEHSKTRSVPAIEELAARLQRNVPEQRETTLVHGDYHINNLIVRDGRIVGVVDWELATLGDPVADVGALLAYWPQQGDQFVGQFGAALADGFPDRTQLADAYFALTGRDRSSLGFWHTLALWKLSIIAEGVLRRVHNDARNAAAVGPTTELVDQIIARAVGTADEVGLE